MKTRMLLALLLTSTLAACASKDPIADKSGSTAGGPSMEAKQMAMEEEASYVTEFAFSKGSAKLNNEAKEDLRKVIAEAKQKGDIKEIKVITWGDVEYPSVHTKKLSSKELDLVKNRNKAIRDYVKSINKDVDLEFHSMAERPGAIKEMFNTDDVRVKRSLEVAGIPNTDTSVKAPSKASKSIVMVIRR